MQKITCSFCGREQSEELKVISNGEGAAICLPCLAYVTKVSKQTADHKFKPDETMRVD